MPPQGGSGIGAHERSSASSSRFRIPKRRYSGSVANRFHAVINGPVKNAAITVNTPMGPPASTARTISLCTVEITFPVSSSRRSGYPDRQSTSYSPAYTEADFPEIMRCSSHITFNSLSQFSRFYPLTVAEGSSRFTRLPRNVACGSR